MKHIEEQIREALHEQFYSLKEGITLPDLWRVTFPLEIGSLKYTSYPGLQVWYRGFASARKLGMWWSMDREDRITLHGTRGLAPVANYLGELILWVNAEAEALTAADPGRVTSKNLTLLTKATEPYSYWPVWKHQQHKQSSGARISMRLCRKLRTPPP